MILHIGFVLFLLMALAAIPGAFDAAIQLYNEPSAGHIGEATVRVGCLLVFAYIACALEVRATRKPRRHRDQSPTQPSARRG